jgi:DNA-binding CsgD family transcriptional regulator
MLCGVAFVQASRAEISAAVTTAEAAVGLAGPLGGAGASAAESTLGWILIVAGEGDRGYPLLLRHAERGHAERRTLESLRESAALGMFAGWMEDYGTARREVERTVAFARDQGLVTSLPLALSALGELEFRVGNWKAARLDAEEALRFAEDAGEFLHYGHNVLLLLDAVAGNAENARANADRALAIAARSGSRSLAMHAHAGLGLLELGLDRPEAAIVQLSQSREIAARGGVKEPNYIRWMPDLIESQIRAGLERDAHSTLQEFEAQARRAGRPWALASSARCQGLLSAREKTDPVFAEAHRLAAALPSPFERARTELCWGERLRRDGRRVEARRHLHDAHQCFASLGAAPWAEKAARELRASGGRARSGPRARSSELTAQQLQIAMMVAEGRTNKSIATALFLSPKTIEFHLGHVYRKLDVSNRTELAHALLVPT